MEDKEYCFTGYCRQIDQSRMVIVEVYDGEMDCSCDYCHCTYAPNCTIARQIKALETP